MNKRERIEAACTSLGLTIQGWHDSEDGPTAELGLAEALEDSDDETVFAGEQGELEACAVGAAEYFNERVCFTLVMDGRGEGDEVDPAMIELI